MKPVLHTILKKMVRLFILIFLVSGIQAPAANAQTFQSGDVFIAVGSGQVQWRNSSGTLIKTLNTGVGGFTTGMAFDKSGNLYVTNFSANSVSKFDTDGDLIGTFGSGYSTPESIIFDADGNAYVGNLGNGIRKYNAAGTFVSTSYNGRVDFIDLFADQCTILRTTEGGQISQHNICTNTALSDFASGLGGNAYALRIRQNGEVLLANAGNVVRLSKTGSVIQTYDQGSEGSWFALNLSPDGTSFWSANFSTSNVYRIDIKTGDVITSFNTGTGGSSVFGLAVFGEFTAGNVYYSKASGNLHNTATWGVNEDGSGTNPPDFGAGKTFNLANRTTNYDMTGNWAVGGILNIPSGSQLRIGSHSLSITTLIGTGTLNGTASSKLSVLGGPMTLNFTSGSNKLSDLVINSNETTTLGDALEVFGLLRVQKGTLKTANALTLKSTATGTARVGQVEGTITGNVTVERYIPARRAWRMMTAPVTSTQTINQGWQEGATTASANSNPAPGFGTHITGGASGTVASGFDQNPGSMASLKRFDMGTGNWVTMTNTNSTSLGTKPYMLFVRGNRGIVMGNENVAPNNTTLRAKGALNTGNQSFSIPASGFVALPNPFASPVNFGSLSKSVIQDNFYAWDPKMGGSNGVGAYVNVSWNGSAYEVMPTPVSPINQIIQSGQAFIVRSKGASGNLVIGETAKSATAATNVFGIEANDAHVQSAGVARQEADKGMKVHLQVAEADQTLANLDGVFLSYNRNYSDAIDNLDVVKMENIHENLAIQRQEALLLVDRRSSVTAADNIPLKVWNTTKRDYTLSFEPLGLANSGMFYYVKDRYKNTTTLLDLENITQINFQVDKNSGSAKPDRFSLVISTTKIQHDGLIPDGITVSPNPIRGKTIVLKMADQPQGLYQVQVVNSLGQQIYRGQVNHPGGTSTQTIQMRNRMDQQGVYMLQVSKGNSSASIKITSEQ